MYYKIGAIIRLVRVNNWVKNLFVICPLFFAGKIHGFHRSHQLIIAFFAFSLASSAIYVFNDLLDRKSDAANPKKKTRPIAAGDVSSGEAVILILLLLAVVSFSLINSGIEKFIILFYVVINIIYSIYLKHVPIIDIVLISIGFVLRVLCGGFAANVPVSKWLVFMTFLLAMCLALGKRREEFTMCGPNHNDIRPALKGYNIDFINVSLAFMSVTTTVCYIMYCMSPDVIARMGTDNIYLTSFFIIIGFLRFLQIAIVENNSGSPTEILLYDRFTQLTLLLWFFTFTVIIYS